MPTHQPPEYIETLTVRDQFAMAALTGLYANSSDAFLTVAGKEAEAAGIRRQSEYYAREAYEAADAMMIAREK